MPRIWSVSEQANIMSAADGPRGQIINFREARDWTQAKAARWWGCSERQWRRYERGDTRVPVPLLKRIARHR